MQRMTLLTTSLLLAGTAFAHGDLKPAHGGHIQEGSRTTVELVVDAAATRVFLSDHGKTVPSAGASGEVILLDGGHKTTVPLTAASDNVLTGPGTTVRAGAKAIVRVTPAGRPTEQLRFALTPQGK